MEDITIQEKVLALAATQTDLDLKKITEFVEAQEQGTRSSKMLVSGVGNLNRISEYKQGQVNNGRENSTDMGKCYFCARAGHGRRPDRTTREEKCKAFNAVCKECQKIGHFASCCRSKGTNTDRKKEVNSMEVREDESFEFFNLTAPATKSGGKYQKLRTLLHHAVDDFGKWLARRPEPQPEVSVAICVSGYRQLELPELRAHHQSVTTSLPDTGA